MTDLILLVLAFGALLLDEDPDGEGQADDGDHVAGQLHPFHEAHR